MRIMIDIITMLMHTSAIILIGEDVNRIKTILKQGMNVNMHAQDGVKYKVLYVYSTIYKVLAFIIYYVISFKDFLSYATLGNNKKTIDVHTNSEYHPPPVKTHDDLSKKEKCHGELLKHCENTKHDWGRGKFCGTFENSF